MASLSPVIFSLVPVSSAIRGTKAATYFFLMLLRFPFFHTEKN